MATLAGRVEENLRSVIEHALDRAPLRLDQETAPEVAEQMLQAITEHFVFEPRAPHNDA